MAWSANAALLDHLHTHSDPVIIGRRRWKDKRCQLRAHTSDRDEVREEHVPLHGPVFGDLQQDLKNRSALSRLGKALAERSFLWTAEERSDLPLVSLALGRPLTEVYSLISIPQGIPDFRGLRRPCLAVVEDLPGLPRGLVPLIADLVK